jgi:dipeptidyl aminopeptidase/acylaminoacyl peptidase
MKRAVCALLVSSISPLGLAQAAVAGRPQAEGKRPSKRYTIEQFMTTTTLSGLSFSSDEKAVLVSSNETGIFNAYTIPVVGGGAVPVTRSTADSTYGVSFFPRDDRILYTRDQGGNENNHLYVIEAEGRERDLTPGEKLKARFVGWSGDDRAFYVATNERDARFFDLYRYDAATYERSLLYKDEAGYDLAEVSRDGRWIAFNKPKTTSDGDIHLYNVATGEMKHVTPHAEPASYAVASFDPGSRWLYYLTNDGSEFTRVRRCALTTGKSEEVERADWDVLYTYFSWGGRYRVTGVNADGRTAVTIHDEKTRAWVELPTLPEGEVRTVTFSRSESRVAFYLNSDRSPSNLYVYDFGTRKVACLTDTLSKEIDPDDLVDSSVVRFRSFDGMTIPSIFYKPHQASAENRVPAMLWVHGGPGGQSRKGYNPLIQYLVNHGYAILAINNRGSSGYGKTFFAADDRKHGREPLWDCVEAKKYLASLPYIDPSRVGIMGGSYGGYMTLAALAFKPDEFAVGVDIFGVSNWPRTLESVPAYWEPIRRALYAEIGDPVKDAAMLRETSPLFHADKIRRPLLVLQGANDPRVIKVESDEIVEAVKKNGVPVEYVVFPDEGHGFTKKKNQIDGYRAIREFLDAHLKGGQAARAAGT